MHRAGAGQLIRKVPWHLYGRLLYNARAALFREGRP
jgi:hypothetical protein